MSINSILKQLKSGNSNFVNDKLGNINKDSTRRKEVVIGQNPFAVVLTCSDSRVVPELIFNTGIGELFVVRVAGNVANPSSIASIEYAVANLDVNLIVVLGHQNCGAVTSAVKGSDASRHIEHLLRFIEPAIQQTDSNIINDISIKNTQLTAKKLTTDSKIIKAATSSRKLKIVSAFYNLETGKVEFFE